MVKTYRLMDVYFGEVVGKGSEKNSQNEKIFVNLYI